MFDFSNIGKKHQFKGDYYCSNIIQCTRNEQCLCILDLTEKPVKQAFLNKIQ